MVRVMESESNRRSFDFVRLAIAIDCDPNSAQDDINQEGFVLSHPLLRDRWGTERRAPARLSYGSPEPYMG
jgi:hypothetical protein